MHAIHPRRDQDHHVHLRKSVSQSVLRRVRLHEVSQPHAGARFTTDEQLAT
jgi:hypothetical protein